MNIFESILLGDETRGPGGQKNGKACKSLPYVSTPATTCSPIRGYASSYFRTTSSLTSSLLIIAATKHIHLQSQPSRAIMMENHKTHYNYE
jgi:hypothetical protein